MEVSNRVTIYSRICLCQDEEDVVSRKRSNHVQRKITSRKPRAKVDPHVEEQFLAGRLLGTEEADTSLVINVTS